MKTFSEAGFLRNDDQIASYLTRPVKEWGDCAWCPRRNVLVIPDFHCDEEGILEVCLTCASQHQTRLQGSKEGE